PEECTTMGMTSPRVRRSAHCTASWIFRIPSAVNSLISPTPRSAAASETSSPSAKTTAGSASTGEPSEISPSQTREICPSATAGHSPEWKCHDHHNDRGREGQEPAWREGEHKRHDAPDGTAFPAMADNNGCENTDHD